MSRRLKILVVGGGSPGAKGALSAQTLAAMGHDAVLFDDWNFGFSSYSSGPNALRWLAASRPTMLRPLVTLTSRRFLRAARLCRPDMILAIRGDRVSRDAFAQAKAHTGARLVNWLSDNVLRLPRLLASLDVFDGLFVKDTFVLEELVRRGYRHVRYLAQCCEPSLHRTLRMSPAETGYYRSDLAIVGAMYPKRLSVAEALVDFDLKIWLDHARLRIPAGSPARSRVIPHRAYGLEQTRVFNAARIVVNSHHEQDVRGVNLRTFEAAGCGAFQLVEWRADLESLFEPGREIVVFREIGELRELARYYLAHDGKRTAIAERAQRRAHGEHTYGHRLPEILRCAA